VNAAAQPGSMTRTELESHLLRERRRVDAALSSLAASMIGPADGRLADPMGYALTSSGKRLRPVLCVAAYRAVIGAGEVPDALYRLSCALEIVHTYSLVHDDLPCMDDDDVRRGRPTVHRVYGVPLATIAGAALLSLAVRVLLEEGQALGLGVERRAELVRELCSAAGADGMVGGQYLDLAGEKRVATAAELEEIHRAKTGALLTASLRLGALAAGASPAQLQALSHYGQAVGLAFQIADDILDVIGDSSALGKTAGRDQALSKSSYPSLYGLDRSQEMARQYAEEAKSALDGLASGELLALADFMVERRS
jgi:geranylgeranyl diphosphate synthase, type II